MILCATVRLMAHKAALCKNGLMEMLFRRSRFRQFLMADKTSAHRSEPQLARRTCGVRAVARHTAFLHLRRCMRYSCLLELFLDVAVTCQAQSAPCPVEQLNLAVDCRRMTCVASGGKRCMHKAIQEFRGVRTVRVMALRTVGFLNRLILVGLSQRRNVRPVTFQTERRGRFVQMENSFRLSGRLAPVRGVTCCTTHVHRCMLRRLLQECFDLGVAREAEVTFMVAAFGSALQQMGGSGAVRIVTGGTRFLTESKVKSGL